MQACSAGDKPPDAGRAAGRHRQRQVTEGDQECIPPPGLEEVGGKNAGRAEEVSNVNSLNR